MASKRRRARDLYYPPLLPGTRAMYNAKGGLSCSVGFRGYLGGLEAIWVISESELAST